MKVYTYSKARQQLASLLKEASRQGRVQIRRRDGTTFEVSPARPMESPLDVPGLRTSITSKEIVSVVRESRKRAIPAGLPNIRMQPSTGATSRRSKRRPQRGARRG